MAFPDWPTSDGYGMFTYPWLRSAGDKFLEHGHRLAGIVIGIASLLLCGTLAWKEPRNWVKFLGAAVLLAVVVQGLLGGLRVLRNAEDLALIHGSGAALVFGLTVGVAVVTSRQWHQPFSGGAATSLPRLRILSIATTICVAIQYVLGGFFRHKGMLLHEHLGFALVAAIMMIWLAMSAASSGIAWLRAPATALAFLTILQLALGAGAWVTKFGFGGEVAVRGSTPAIATSSLHVVTGALLFGTCVALVARIARLQWFLNGGHSKRLNTCSIDASRPLAGGAP
jgi:cytochrome c oxidase assembly protein subunit 15